MQSLEIEFIFLVSTTMSRSSLLFNILNITLTISISRSIKILGSSRVGTMAGISITASTPTMSESRSSQVTDDYKIGQVVNISSKRVKDPNRLSNNGGKVVF